MHYTTIQDKYEIGDTTDLGHYSNGATYRITEKHKYEVVAIFRNYDDAHEYKEKISNQLTETKDTDIFRIQHITIIAGLDAEKIAPIYYVLVDHESARTFYNK